MSDVLTDVLDGGARVAVAGITGRYGAAQTRAMLDDGTRVVAGVGPGRGGQEVHGVPVFESFAEARAATEPNVAVVYVAAARAKQPALDALDAGVRFLMVATEGVPLHDTLVVKERAEQTGAWFLGPNTIGLLRPGRCLIGTLRPDGAFPGPVAVISRSGTLSIEATRLLSREGLGQSLCVAVGGDRIVGRNPAAWLRLAEADPQTRAVVLVGEVGGRKEYEAAAVVAEMTKPVVAYIVGRHAPRDSVMGHVGAIVRHDEDTAQAKSQALHEAGATVASTLWEMPALIRDALEAGGS